MRSFGVRKHNCKRMLKAIAWPVDAGDESRLARHGQPHNLLSFDSAGDPPYAWLHSSAAVRPQAQSSSALCRMPGTFAPRCTGLDRDLAPQQVVPMHCTKHNLCIIYSYIMSALPHWGQHHWNKNAYMLLHPVQTTPASCTTNTRPMWATQLQQAQLLPGTGRACAVARYCMPAHTTQTMCTSCQPGLMHNSVQTATITQHAHPQLPSHQLQLLQACCHRRCPQLHPTVL
jgi:hypothetical protein